MNKEPITCHPEDALSSLSRALNAGRPKDLALFGMAM
jgi:hypothetical protein